MYRKLLSCLALIAIMASTFSCHDTKSYAELLRDENIAVNSFLANHKVIGYEKRDSTFNFISGQDAPYYQLDEEGNLYMQVVKPGTAGYRAATDQLIYFRFTRYNLENMKDGELPTGDGNDHNMSTGSASFRFNNLSSSASYQWGSGLQAPLIYLPLDCEVNIIIKSQLGPTSEIGTVVPFLYSIRYFKSQI